jgi:hypothetical protein
MLAELGVRDARYQTDQVFLQLSAERAPSNLVCRLPHAVCLVLESLAIALIPEQQ